MQFTKIIITSAKKTTAVLILIVFSKQHQQTQRSKLISSLLIVFVDNSTEDLEGFLHGREAAVLVVTVVDAGVTVAADLDIKAGRLEVSHKGEAAGDGVGLALTKNVSSSSVQVLEGRRVKVDRYALYTKF